MQTLHVACMETELIVSDCFNFFGSHNVDSLFMCISNLEK